MVDLTFKNTGPTLTEENIARLEDQLQCRLPADYRDFLLKHNGGRPSRVHFSILLGGETEEWWIDSFYSVDEHLAQPSSEARGATLSCAHFTDGEFVPRDCLVIGSAVRDDRLLLRLSGDRRGQIDMKFGEDMDQADPEGGIYPLAESFCAFLRSLY